MRELQWRIAYKSVQIDELSETDRELVEMARQATYRSYAPYSHFCVGAAVRMANDAVVSGSNQENVSFGATTCAERCALHYANAAYPNVAVSAIAIAARDTHGDFTQKPISPCGICRQVLVEVQQRAGHDVRILLYGTNEVLVLPSVSGLLPFQFDEIV